LIEPILAATRMVVPTAIFTKLDSILKWLSKVYAIQIADGIIRVAKRSLISFG
jgi:hypothetical protein